MPKNKQQSATNDRSQEKKVVEKNFTWTEEETALLIKVVIDYKAAKSSLALDCETIRNRYEELVERLEENYPSDLTEGFPNVGNTKVFTKERLLRKLKRIKLSFRKAVDSGRRSGGGRVVMALYDECYEVWAGSPAVESLETGIETSTLDTEEDSVVSEEKDTEVQDSVQSSSSQS